MSLSKCIICKRRFFETIRSDDTTIYIQKYCTTCIGTMGWNNYLIAQNAPRLAPTEQVYDVEVEYIPPVEIEHVPMPWVGLN